mgnify:CR=1 FL=1
MAAKLSQTRTEEENEQLLRDKSSKSFVNYINSYYLWTVMLNWDL